MERFDDELLDDDLDRLSEEMEGQNYRVYTRLNDLAWTKKNGVTKSTKKEIWSHLLKYNSFSAEWFQSGEKLWQKAKAEQAKKADNKLMPYFYISDYQDTDKVSHLAECWEEWLTTKSVINRDEDGYSRSKFHRTGLKRDKTEFWNRPKTRRHQIKRLAKQQLLQHQQRRQNDNQLQQV